MLYLSQEVRMILAVALFALVAPFVSMSDASCRTARITGYVRTEFSPHTYDGTSIYTDEPIVAASLDIPIDATVEIEGLGTFRVADRGKLGNSNWVDVAVWTRSEAYELTGERTICVTP